MPSMEIGGQRVDMTVAEFLEYKAAIEGTPQAEPEPQPETERNGQDLPKPTGEETKEVREQAMEELRQDIIAKRGTMALKTEGPHANPRQDEQPKPTDMPPSRPVPEFKTLKADDILAMARKLITGKQLRKENRYLRIESDGKVHYYMYDRPNARGRRIKVRCVGGGIEAQIMLAMRYLAEARVRTGQSRYMTRKEVERFMEVKEGAYQSTFSSLRAKKLIDRTQLNTWHLTSQGQHVPLIVQHER